MNEINLVRVSVTEPVGDALRKTTEVLFKPFDPVKWLVIGFCAWLAYLGEGGIGGGGGGSSNNGAPWNKEYFFDNLPFIISITSIILILIIAVVLLVIWVRSRGKFMFLHCIALNVGEVAWKKYAKQANSLFLFLLLISILSFVCFIPFIILIVFMAIAVYNSSMALPVGIVAIISTVFVMIILGVLFALVGKFTNDFVVPIMYLRGVTCMEGWSEFWKLLGANKGQFVLYILFQIVLFIAVISIIIATSCFCCCLGCLFAIPYIGTVLLLPIFVFMRSYSLYYLAQYGRALNVFVPHNIEDANALPELVQ